MKIKNILALLCSCALAAVISSCAQNAVPYTPVKANDTLIIVTETMSQNELLFQIPQKATPAEQSAATEDGAPLYIADSKTNLPISPALMQEQQYAVPAITDGHLEILTQESAQATFAVNAYLEKQQASLQNTLFARQAREKPIDEKVLAEAAAYRLFAQQTNVAQLAARQDDVVAANIVVPLFVLFGITGFSISVLLRRSARKKAAGRE